MTRCAPPMCTSISVGIASAGSGARAGCGLCRARYWKMRSVPTSKSVPTSVYQPLCQPRRFATFMRDMWQNMSWKKFPVGVSRCAEGVLEIFSSWCAERGLRRVFNHLALYRCVSTVTQIAFRDLNFQVADREGFSSPEPQTTKVGTEVGEALSACFFYLVPTSIPYYIKTKREPLERLKVSCVCTRARTRTCDFSTHRLVQPTGGFAR